MKDAHLEKILQQQAYDRAHHAGEDEVKAVYKDLAIEFADIDKRLSSILEEVEPLLEALETDFELLRDESWIPERHSLDASQDVIEEIRRILKGEPKPKRLFG
jgi:hypothetical protein